MAEEHAGAPARAPWLKIFTGFKVALDMKKLVLAAAGIFLVWAGWWVIGWTFYSMHKFPEYVYKENDKSEWTQFKARRGSWNLIHELAGSPSDHHQRVDAADVAGSHEEYVLLHKWEAAYKESLKPVQVNDKTLEAFELKFTLTPIAKDEDDAKAIFDRLRARKLTPQSLVLVEVKGAKDDEKVRMLKIGDDLFKVEGPFEDLKKRRDEAMTIEQIAMKAGESPASQETFKKFQTHLVNPKIKPSGLLRISPWSEDRGENQFLIVTKTLQAPGHTASTGNNVLTWLLSAKSLVLLEPLVKFLAPIFYLFDPRASFWIRFYLITIMVWTLAIWGFFGGAICRIAAVQVARNERISLREAILFTKERFASFVAAPLFPMVLLAIFIFVLMIFGWLVWIPWFGELFAGLLWPIVILIGFTMAIVMVGLVGWPLMIATISTEGTDSFDALSRSYSYIYQAPWQYLWYNFLAVVYGAALIFFVGFMASLMMFAGKWGVSSAAGLSKIDPKDDREPSYLFNDAPTSYGWRDLLISSNMHVVPKKVLAPDGREVERLDFTADYQKSITGMNAFGGWLVQLWVWPFFLIVLGFGYSYFWSSSTIIYFLMRRYVDDTEMDEVHQDDEDLDDPFLKPPPAAAPPAPAPASKPGTVSLNVVDAPPPGAPSYSADVPPPSPPPSEMSSPPPEPPPAAPENPPADGHPQAPPSQG